MNSCCFHHSSKGLNLFLLQENDLKKTVDESARIRRAYSHYFDLTIVNDNLDKAFDKLQEAVERLFIEPQWVPVSWVYWCFTAPYWTDMSCPTSQARDESGHLKGGCIQHCATHTDKVLDLPDSFLAHYATHNTQEVYLFIGTIIF